MGMKWGVRKPEGTGKSFLPTHNLENPSRKKLLESNGLSDDVFRIRHGAIDYIKDHKKQIEIGSAVLLAAAALGAAYYYRQDLVNLSGMGESPEHLRCFADVWTQEVSLAPGHILQRVSKTAEVTPNPKGFFSTFNPSDSARYRQMWASHPFQMQYRAKVPVRAPSGEQTVNMFKEFTAKDSQAKKWVKDYVRYSGSGAKTLRGSSAHDWEKSLQMITGSTYINAQGTQRDMADGFLDHLRSKGYNAIIDFYDAGVIAKSPLLTLNGADFDIVGAVSTVGSVV
jgi:hypothetical protein